MKKPISLIAVLLSLSFTFCKKDRTCTCGTETPQGVLVTETVMFDITKHEGRDNCIGSQITIKTASTSTTGVKTTCKLK